MFELKSQSLIFVVLIVLLAIPTSLAYAVSFTPFVEHPNAALGWLHTDGSKIKDDTGQIVYLRGVAYGNLASLFHWQNLDLKFSQMLVLLGTPVIRCAISPAPDGNWTGWTNPEFFDVAVDQLVNLCIANKVYMVIEFHGISNAGIVAALKADPSPWIDWLLHFVNRYKSIPNVCGFEIWNEPSSGLFTQAEWRTIAVPCYNTIHAANPNALIIVASVPFTAINQDWIDNPLGDQAVYSWDSYYHNWGAYYNDPYDAADYVTGKERMTALLYESKHINASLPIWNTEFGWTQTDNLQACQDYFDLMNEANNSWYCWWWHGNPANYGLVTDEAFTTLTSYGSILETHLTGLPSSTDPLFSGVKFKFREYDSYLNFDSQASFTRAEINDANINFTDLTMVGLERSSFGIETDMNVTVADFFNGENRLFLDVYGTGTSTINLYGLSDLGEPTEVQGATFVYSGGVLTLSSPITDFQEIRIYWYQNFIDQYFPLMIFIVGFVCFFLPLGIIFWRRPDPATCIKLIMVSFIGFAVLMFSGSA